MNDDREHPEHTPHVNEVGAGMEADEGEVNSRKWRGLLGRYISGLNEAE